MTEKDQNSGADQTSDDVTVETTSVFRADFLNELDAPAAAGTEGAVSGVEGLPVGSALLVVKRGPNAGSRFLLDQPTTSAGRHPDSDIFLDDVTVSRRHAEFRLENGEFQVVDVGSLNGTYVNREPVDSAVLANGDEVQIGKFRLVFLTGPKTDDDSGRLVADERLREEQMTAPDTPALTGMSIGAVLDSAATGLPGRDHLQDPVPGGRGTGHTGAHRVGLSAVHRLRLRAAALHPDRAARPVPAAEGHQGAAGRPARRRTADAPDPPTAYRVWCRCRPRASRVGGSARRWRRPRCG